jgi:hypothetical protein
MDMDTITEARRKAIATSIHSISAAEMKTLGEKLFPFHDDPWRTAFFEFLEQNPHGSFHHATTDDGVEILYCHDKNKGIWFVPKSGLGPLQTTGLKLMSDAVIGG